MKKSGRVQRTVVGALMAAVGIYGVVLSTQTDDTAQDLQAQGPQAHLRRGAAPAARSAGPESERALDVDLLEADMLDELDALAEEQAYTKHSPARFEMQTLGSGENSYRVVAGELLVRVDEGLGGAEVARLADKLGSAVLSESRVAGLYRLKVPEGEQISGFVRTLEATPGVRSAQPNAVAEGAWLGFGTHRSKQWNFHELGMDELDDLEPSAMSQIVVAVMDTGVAYEDRDERGSGGLLYKEHADLEGVTFTSPKDVINGDLHPNDDHSHGSHITGIIAARGKVTGLAQDVQIMPIKVLDANKLGSELEVIEGLYHAVDNGAHIINMSLSFGLGYFPGAALQEAISHAVDNDVLIVASAGNKGRWGVSYPAAFPDVIAVGASRLTGLMAMFGLATYGSYGFPLDVAAPGGLIGTDFDGDGWPDGILSLGFNKGRPNQTGYWYCAGTSQSVAHVSAAAAWLLSEGATAAEVLPALQKSAVLPSSSRFHPTYGSGNINIKAARDLVRSNAPVPVEAYYVNITPWFEQSSGSNRVGAARVVVMNSAGQRVPNVVVGGSWFGSWTSFDAYGVTNAQGEAVIKTPTLGCAGGCAVGFQVDRAYSNSSVVKGNPLGFYSLSPASAEVFYALKDHAELADASVLYHVGAGDPSLSGYASGGRSIAESYVLRTAAGGARSGPIAIALDAAFAPSVTSAAGTPVSFNFAQPLGYGGGAVSSVAGERVDASNPRLGSASRFLILPLDPAMGSLDITRYYPLINAVGASFHDTNQAFGNSITSPSLGDAFMSSSLGDAFMSSSLGDAFMSSSLGDAFMSSSLGDAFMSSSLGDAFMSSSLGDAFMSSSMGNDFEAMGMANSSGDAVAAGTESEGDTPLSMEEISASDTEPTITGLITDEALLEEELPTVD